MNERLMHLLDRELDGSLTSVERDELERLIKMEPAARRDREAWRRVVSTIASDGARAPQLEVARMSARVLNGRSRTLTVPMRWFRPRTLLAASTLAAIALVFLASKHTAPKPEHVVAPKIVAAPVARVIAAVRPPVDVSVDETSTDDDRSALVEIRF